RIVIHLPQFSHNVPFIIRNFSLRRVRGGCMRMMRMHMQYTFLSFLFFFFYFLFFYGIAIAMPLHCIRICICICICIVFCMMLNALIFLGFSLPFTPSCICCLTRFFGLA